MRYRGSRRQPTHVAGHAPAIRSERGWPEYFWPPSYVPSSKPDRMRLWGIVSTRDGLGKVRYLGPGE